MVNITKYQHQETQLDLFSNPEPANAIASCGHGLAKPKKFELRDYQKQVISDIYRLFKIEGVRSAMLYAPTGSGKTACSTRLIADAVKRGRRVLFAVHRKKLVSQTQQELLDHHGIESGIIWADEPMDYSKPVQIAMIQTLQSRPLPEDIGLVIFDECHSSIYYSISRKIISHYSTTEANPAGLMQFSPCFFVGLTATPWRSKSRQGFCQFFQGLVRAPDPIDLVKMGYLSRPRLFGYGGLIDFSQLESTQGEYSNESMRKACGEEYNASVVENYTNLCKERKAIAFCSGVSQAYDLAKQFEEAGLISEVIIGATPDDEREAIYERFRMGETRVLSSVGALVEGFDEPSVEAVILARPTRSKALLLQMVGRGLRLFPGKKDCYLLDFGECFKRVCRPTTKLKISLCPNTKPPSAEGLGRECPECGYMVSNWDKICPHCGYEFPENDKPQDDDEDLPTFGELLDPEEMQQLIYLRAQMKTKYSKGQNPARVKGLFYKKFGYFPHDDWFVGAIFGVRIRHKSTRIIYQEFLHSINPDAPKYWVRQLMDLEFGKNWKTYHFKDGGEYKPKSMNVGRKTWWDVLNCNANDSWQMIKDSYRELAKQWHPDICGDEVATQEMQLINWAFEEGKKCRK